SSKRTDGEERLLWSRDLRFAHRLAADLPNVRAYELDAGAVLIAPAAELTDAWAAEVAAASGSPGYGLVTLNPALPEGERHLVALSAAVQQSGLAERIGMAQSSQLVQTKLLDYFFSLRHVHGVAYQPIVELGSGRLVEYECLFRPQMPGLETSITSIVQAAIDTGRTIELDRFIVRAILERVGGLQRDRAAAGTPPIHVAINFTPASLLDSQFEAATFAATVKDAGLDPRQITLECTEQQAVSEIGPLVKQVKALRRLGFGFAIDDAGAGYASFSLIAALRPSVIKIDREIASGIARDDAKQALVEAFVSFGGRIGALLLAEGIERRADLAMLTALGVHLGQGFLIGKPNLEPLAPRPMETLRLDAARYAIGSRVRAANAASPAARPSPAALAEG
ncbi:MAG TPA: EAL domain-containing protein, partial [Candidatus Limnocylindrales bacterium]|nr:EAL domain-containing protein [Candidatus Limnocylindrales bacterium]